MIAGWVKLHRTMLDWEWYDDINTKVVFLHLMLKANHKDKKYRGVVIKRGQLLTGREVLANETGLTQQQIRTCLTKLKSTSNITIKSTNKGTLVTVENYGVYQGDDSESTSRITSNVTNEQPTSNQQVTTNKNVKKEKNVKNKEITSLKDDGFDHWWKAYPKKVAKPAGLKAFKSKTKNMGEDSFMEFVDLISSDSINRYAQTEKQFIPNPATYLNEERYNDE